MIRSDRRKLSIIESWQSFATWKSKTQSPGDVLKTPEMIIAPIERQPPPSFCGVMTLAIGGLAEESLVGNVPFPFISGKLAYAKRVFELMSSVGANISQLDSTEQLKDLFPPSGPDPVPNPVEVANRIRFELESSSGNLAHRWVTPYQYVRGYDSDFYFAPTLNMLYIKAHDLPREVRHAANPEGGPPIQEFAQFGRQYPLIQRRITKLIDAISDYLSDPLYEAPNGLWGSSWKYVYKYIRDIWPVLREIMILAYFIERFDNNPLVRPSTGLRLPRDFPADSPIWNFIEETYDGSFHQ